MPHQAFQTDACVTANSAVEEHFLEGRRLRQGSEEDQQIEVLDSSFLPRVQGSFDRWARVVFYGLATADQNWCPLPDWWRTRDGPGQNLV